MADSATLNHAARIVAATSHAVPADAALRHYFLETRHLGPRERRAISRMVFARFRWLKWLDPKASFQKQLEHASTLQQRFNADERAFKPETLAARAVPDWLRGEMDLTPEYLRQLQREPALWLRARPGTAAKLARELGHCEPAALGAAVSSFEFGALRSGPAAPSAELQSPAPPLPNAEGETPIDRLRTPGSEPETGNSWPRWPALAADALRYTGTQDLFVTRAFHEGAFEIQDLASQLVGIACAPTPSETWWDACAGEGGKTLHLADLMHNKGVIWASDRNERRLQILKRRAARAELFNYRTVVWNGGQRLPTKTHFDGILLDAPCSGIGTWQRNPHARWSTAIEDVHELATRQRTLLDHAAGALKPGGRLLYSVCTLARSETTAVAESFSAAHPELEPAALFGAPAASPASQLFLWPHELDANGMFIAAWRRR